MNIVPKLSLNKHPKDYDNLSFVNALNVKVSNDESCITNEEGIKANKFIRNYLTNYYNENYKIVGIISCNEELVIITIAESNQSTATIFRYIESGVNTSQDMKVAYTNLKYSNGEIKGTFTYNVEGSLIIAIAESKATEDVPLRTINLGKFDDEEVYSDKNLPNNSISIIPEIRLPFISNHNYTKGNCYKGWWHFFLRFKISDNNYTQWYNFGYPVFVDSVDPQNIIRYCYGTNFALKGGEFKPGDALNQSIGRYKARSGFIVGCADAFSDTTDIANSTIQLDINIPSENKTNGFTKFQLGFICGSKSYTKAFKSNDIDIENTINYIINLSNISEYNVNDLITSYTNYFNVGNIVNYNNRLYISNYKETNINVDLTEYTKNIKVNPSINKFQTNDLMYSIPLLNTMDRPLYGNEMGSSEDNTLSYTQSNQYDSPFSMAVNLAKYLNIKENTSITVSNYAGKTQTGYASDFWIIPIPTNGQYIYPALCGVWKGYYPAMPPNVNDIITGSIYININDDSQDKSTISLVSAQLCYIVRYEYINTKNSFEERCKNTTLIPGEIYNFFVHYVDKYGNATNGIRIDNNAKVLVGTQEVIPIPFTDSVGTQYYAAANIDSNVTNGTSLNGIMGYYRNIISNVDGTYSMDGSVNMTSAFNSFYKSFIDNKYAKFKWYQIANVIDCRFGVFINNNGERLFKVPELIQHNHYATSIDNGRIYEYNFIKPSFSNIQIPDGYVGYFISYEKFESIKRATGLLTRADSMLNYKYEGSDRTVSKAVANTGKSNTMMFFSDVFDIADSIKLDFSVLNIESIYIQGDSNYNMFTGEDIKSYDGFMRSDAVKFPYENNKPQVAACNTSKYMKIFAMPNYKLGVGDSAKDERVGKGTGIIIDDSYNLFNAGNNVSIKMYRATLINANRNIYTSNSKTLIRLTDIIYINSFTVNEGLNGHLTYNNFLVYNDNGVSFNDTDKKALNITTNKEYYPFISENDDNEVSADKIHYGQINVPFVGYIQMPIIDSYMHESKCFNNAPANIIYPIQQCFDNASAKKGILYNGLGVGCFVTPANSVDLFQNRQGNQDDFNPKTYTNYREDLLALDRFDKTVRRSDIIQDESRDNAWRRFPLEGYKNITENKGNITNLIGIGTMFLVHTEHSLFMFDVNNSLKTEDKDIQLYQPDIFDVNYKEVFTSEFGFGGLQDDKAFTIDQFGYIFYNDDFNRFYQFDNGQLAPIDNDIIEWLNVYKPFKVRFANDKFNNRLLIKLDFVVNNEVVSDVFGYNYNTKNFVSRHSYYFEQAFNTKTNLYLKSDNEFGNRSLHQFVKESASYGIYDNIKQSIDTEVLCPSYIDIILNVEYSYIKFIEFITYKLNKVRIPRTLDQVYSPVEGLVTPWSGDYLSVYNNLVNTGELNINISTEDAKNVFANFDKPYWELGNWNFSYLRNKISEINTGIRDDSMSRIFGNYFIIKFKFTNNDNLLIEFEDLGFNVTKDKRI